MRSAPPNTTTKSPAKFTTDLDAMELCADLVGGRKQNKEYWATVAVPLDPIRAVPYEGLMRTAVFLPLAGVAATFGYLGMKWGLASCAVALPLMAAIHNKVRRTVLDHLTAAAELDQGRYAAVNYLAEKMGLAPKHITWGLVSELAVVYAKAWLKAEAAHKEAQASTRAAAAAAAAAEEAKRRGRSTGRYTGGRKATGAAVAASGAAGVGYAMADAADVNHINFDASNAPAINPANGQLMMNDLVDVHGNMYGTTDVDDAMDYSVHHASSDTFDYGAVPVFDPGSFGAAPGYGFD